MDDRGGSRRRPARLGVALLAALLSAGCDRQRIEALEVGVATEAEVRRQFGVPAAAYREADGSTTLEYPRQPEGRQNYMITIGVDGRMSALGTRSVQALAGVADSMAVDWGSSFTVKGSPFRDAGLLRPVAAVPRFQTMTAYE